MPKTSSTRITYDTAQIAQLLERTKFTSTQRAAQHTAQRANQNVLAAGRVATGALATSYQVKQSRELSGRFAPGHIVFSELPYSGWQEDGIGPYVCPPGRVMRFKPKGSSVFIFRTKRKGFEGARQLRDALAALTVADFLPSR